MDVVEEAKIIGRVQAGRTDDFAYLVHRYERNLFRIVGSLIASSQVEEKSAATRPRGDLHLPRRPPP